MDVHPATRSAQAATELLAAAPQVDLPEDVSAEWRQLASLTEAPAVTLDSDTLAALALSFRWCRRAEQSLAAGAVTGASRRRVIQEIEAREAHLSLLLAGVHRLIRQIVQEKVTARYGAHWGEALLEDVLAEAYAVAIDAAAGFDPDKGVPFAAYLAQRVRSAVGDTAFRYTASGNMRTSCQRVGRITAAVEQSLYGQLQRAATDDELRAAVEAETRAWAIERIDPELTGEDREKAIRSKLVKQGTAAALDDLAEIRRISSGEVSLDRPVGADGDSTATVGSFVVAERECSQQVEEDADAARLLAVLRLALSGLDPELAARVVSRLEGDDSDGRGTAAVAVRNLRARIASPHVQFAALAPHLDEEFVDTSDASDGWQATVDRIRVSARLT